MAKRLGKGLGAIISTTPPPKSTGEVEETIVHVKGDSIVEIPLDQITTNPDQPRTHFDDVEIENLAESIRSVGLIQPILLRKANDNKDGYTIIAGERRFRAAKSLELDTIRAIVIKANEEENVTIALIENIQRQDLDPIEEAKAYRLLINRFNMKQNDVAKRVGKERATIANSIRLLSLPDIIINAISEGSISQGHAKVLLGVPGSQKEYYFGLILSQNLSVRALESLIKSNQDKLSGDSQSKKNPKDPHIKKMEDKLVSTLGTKVEIKHSATGKGRIEINYYSLDDFERILEKFE
ncbi:MAG: ParB/RepB/Spo0J family partition protein [Spirochaetes bacterium]|jgi:ParB family chromosome partitioning protein|nr:ParB/RepB/Spo0J family partition protein [Spirochaetota bacterium]